MKFEKKEMSNIGHDIWTKVKKNKLYTNIQLKMMMAMMNL